MKIYVIRFSETDYDQYYGFVVCANNRDDVIEIIKKYANGENVLPKGAYTIKEVTTKKRGIILDSFNAG